MGSQVKTSLSIKIILGYLTLILVLKTVGIVMGGNVPSNISQIIVTGLITAGMYFRVSAAYYLFYIFITISLYGTAAVALIESMTSKGSVLSDPAFIASILLTLIPLVLLYKLMGREEVKAHYVRTEA